jgi:acyl dehydratase
MMQTISKNDIGDYIGEVLGQSDWLLIDQERINSFAESTDDFQFIHVDENAAAKTAFGGTIAHGFLTLSLLSSLCSDLMLKIDGTVMSLNYGFDKVRFLSPVKVGSRVRAHAKLLESVEKNPGQILAKHEVTIEIEGEDKPALVAEWLGMTIVG